MNNVTELLEDLSVLEGRSHYITVDEKGNYTCGRTDDMQGSRYEAGGFTIDSLIEHLTSERKRAAEQAARKAAAVGRGLLS